MAAGEIGSEIIPGKSDPAFRAAIVGISLLLAFSTVYTQWRAYGGEFLETAQAGGHRAILENKASSPFQYRVLTEWGLELILRWSRRCGISSPVPAFILARGLQNFVIFILAAVWYRRVAGKGRRIVLGLVLLAWGMSYAFRDSTLEFSTYSEVIFYLLAALAISARRDWWIPAITLAAALNRETAAFIPFAYLAGRIQLPFSKRTGNGRALLLFVLSLGLYLGVFLGLRLHFGWQPLARVWQHRAGIDLLVF
ncbi:MAG: hypothetical protein NTV79_03970, partial [Candidatus Aureabacteria bacterium]|nr:hypothetical protein [Candidatus Auribacterota bacterium]